MFISLVRDKVSGYVSQVSLKLANVVLNAVVIGICHDAYFKSHFIVSILIFI